MGEVPVSNKARSKHNSRCYPEGESFQGQVELKYTQNVGTLGSEYPTHVMAQQPASAVVTLAKAHTSPCDWLGKVICDFSKYRDFEYGVYSTKAARGRLNVFLCRCCTTTACSTNDHNKGPNTSLNFV